MVRAVAAVLVLHNRGLQEQGVCQEMSPGNPAAPSVTGIFRVSKYPTVGTGQPDPTHGADLGWRSMSIDFRSLRSDGALNRLAFGGDDWGYNCSHGRCFEACTATVSAPRRLESLEESGVAPTGVSGVTFFWIGEPVPRTPLIYSAGIVIVGQGHMLRPSEHRTRW